MRRFSKVGIVFLLLISGCYGRGSPDSIGINKESGSDLQTIKADFETLKNKILIPHSCLRCHAEMGTEAGIRKYLVPGNPDESEIFQRVRTGNMPLEGAKLSQEKVDFFRRYILELAPAPPVITPVDSEPAFEATYRSLSYYLVQKSCLPCHSTQNAKGKKIALDTYEGLKSGLSDVLFQIQIEEMPPEKSRKPIPTPETVQLLEDWVKNGFPN